MFDSEGWPGFYHQEAFPQGATQRALGRANRDSGELLVTSFAIWSSLRYERSARAFAMRMGGLGGGVAVFLGSIRDSFTNGSSIRVESDASCAAVASC